MVENGEEERRDRLRRSDDVCNQCLLLQDRVRRMEKNGESVQLNLKNFVPWKALVLLIGINIAVFGAGFSIIFQGQRNGDDTLSEVKSNQKVLISQMADVRRRIDKIKDK